MELGIKNRLALVTGCSRGIGRAIALELAREGARVIIVARTKEPLEALRNEMAASGQDHRAIVMDLMADDAPEQLAKTIMTEIGNPEIVVHNLGGSNGVFKTFAPASDWQKVWRFNVGIGHDLNRAFIPPMIERRWGRIVHLSTLSTTTYGGYTPYASAKCALNGYVKSVNKEISKDNVIMSAVAPGAIVLEGRYFAKLEHEDPAGREDYFKQNLPIRRFGRAEEVAKVVAFLSSDHAAFMAGSIVGIDGGGR